MVVNIPDEFLAQREFALVLGALQLLPRRVDVGELLALRRRERLHVVGAHPTLDREEKHLQVAFLLEPGREGGTSLG